MDRDLRDSFGSGEIAAWLVGDGRYFIRAPDYEVHDRLFVIGELLAWSREEDGRTSSASRGLTEAVQMMLAAGRIDDAIDILISYVVAARGIGHLMPLAATAVSAWLDQAREAYTRAGNLDSQRVGALEHLRSELVPAPGD